MKKEAEITKGYMTRSRFDPHYVKSVADIEPPAFNVNERVEKYTGYFKPTGEIRAIYWTSRGRCRYVVEVDDVGLQMIYSSSQLRRI